MLFFGQIAERRKRLVYGINAGGKADSKETVRFRFRRTFRQHKRAGKASDGERRCAVVFIFAVCGVQIDGHRFFIMFFFGKRRLIAVTTGGGNNLLYRVGERIFRGEIADGILFDDADETFLAVGAPDGGGGVVPIIQNVGARGRSSRARITLS